MKSIVWCAARLRQDISRRFPKHPGAPSLGVGVIDYLPIIYSPYDRRFEKTDIFDEGHETKKDPEAYPFSSTSSGLYPETTSRNMF